VLLVAWPLSSVFKNRPEDIGEVIDGRNAPPLPDGSSAVVAQHHFSTAEALRTPSFWLLSLGHGCALLVVYAVNVHAIAHIKDSMGYSLSQASFFISMVTMCQILGVVIGGWLGDKFEKRWLAAGCMLGHAVGLTLLAFASNAFMLSAFAIVHGTAWGMRGPMMQAMRADYFGAKSIGMILGISSMVIVLGQVGGPMITAIIADMTGNYKIGFCLLALIVGLGSIFFITAKKPVGPVLQS
jgi:MFS family permease